MAQGKVSQGNDSSTYGFTSTSANSFPQYKNMMPNDQVAKLLAMHRESTANAGIYVAVVLAVYVVLLSLLLCRYVRRRGPRELPGLPGINATPPSTNQSALYCACCTCPCQMASCISQSGFLSALRHCSISTRTGNVSSLSSDSKDEIGGEGNEEHNQSMTIIRSLQSSTSSRTTQPQQHSSKLITTPIIETHCINEAKV